jgi:hypothetical protein
MQVPAGSDNVPVDEGGARFGMFAALSAVIVPERCRTVSSGTLSARGGFGEIAPSARGERPPGSG